MTSKEFYEARIRLGLTQNQLGKIMGRDQPFISHIERERFTPTMGQAAHVKNLLKWHDGCEFDFGLSEKIKL